ncbi:MAG: zf-HC2 domain-containing protein [Gemmatimonadetes bacterium]|nr:zf-HC2 domain-containing protein [Gemmatimonadota bacterium]
MTTDAVTMVCKEFIDRYTDYRDELLSSDERARFEEHLEDCESCRRYERVLSRGLTLWRGLPVASASPDFLPRLQHRLYHVEDAGKLSTRRHLGSAALVAVASVGLLAVTWMPFAARASIEVELPAVAVEVPVTFVADGQPSLFEEPPYVGPFLAPLGTTLDEPAGLFTTNYVPIRGDSTSPTELRRTGQLDESR